MSVADAIAHICPVVVPVEPPFDEFIDHDIEGKLFRHGSARSAVARVEEFLRDPDARLNCGSRARERILEHHQFKQATAQWIESIMVPEPAYGAY